MLTSRCPDDSLPARRTGGLPWGSLLSGCALGSALVLLLACGGGGGSGEPEAQAFGLSTRVPLAPLAFPGVAPDPAPVGIERAFPSLFFDGGPLFLTTAPDARRMEGDPAWLYVVERDGQIHVFANDDAAASTSLLIDLTAANGGPVSRATDEEGLLGLAFDPDFATNGYFYVHYSAASPRRSMFARYQAEFPADASLPPAVGSGAPLIILEVAQPFSNHNAGMIAFGPDAMLYIGLGDGGSGNDPQRHGQNLTTLLGSMLRIDVRGATAATPYVIPADNPFVGLAGRDEIWAYGLRNPWRFSFDRGTGDLWVGDVGQLAREEVDVVVRGGNYGWVAYEGDLEHLNTTAIPASALVPPVVAYGRTEGSTVIGGYRYRGQDVPTLAGAYVYGDAGSARIWALVPDGAGGTTSNVNVASLAGIVSFGEDERGELYGVALLGTLHRFIEPAGTPPPVFPDTLSGTGLFQDVGTLAPAAGVIEYAVNAPRWSDGAVARRWMALPNETRIVYADSGAWTFPTGTVLVEHIELALVVGDPASRRRVETRVLILQPAGWAGYTYRWNVAQTDALLLPGAATDNFTIQDPAAPGGQRVQAWAYPSRAQCLQCHTAASGRVLGVRAGQLNRTFGYAGGTDNQLRAFNHIGLFSTDIGSAPGAEAWVDPADSALAVNSRARAYLAANCAHCHRPGSSTPGGLDFRHATPNALMGAINAMPMAGGLGLPDPRVITPGNKEASVLWERVRVLGAPRMPALGSSRIHNLAVQLFGDWIDGGP